MTEPSTPLMKRGELSAPKRLASSTASLAAIWGVGMGSGVGGVVGRCFKG